jgi:hypothetical protein
MWRELLEASLFGRLFCFLAAITTDIYEAASYSVTMLCSLLEIFLIMILNQGGTEALRNTE